MQEILKLQNDQLTTKTLSPKFFINTHSEYVEFEI